MPKGQKQCNSCQEFCGPRAFVCPKCNAPFVFKVKSKDKKNTKIIRDVDWKTLVMGDTIKVNGGPYFMNKDGEYVPMGYRGRFIVEKLDSKGIIAWGTDKHSGCCHIYMGQDFHDTNTGLRKTAHKLVKLKKKENVNP
jgi:hypothetical protein